MTKQAGFKRRVRARMAKTARGRLLAEHPGTTPDDSPLDWMPEAPHISNGGATDVPGTGLARRVVYWRDVLHEGPVPEAAPAELRRIRADYLAGYEGVERAEAMRQFTERDQALEANRDGSACCGSRRTCTTSCRSQRSSLAWAPWAFPPSASP
jgi:hypothetical protein